MGGKFLKSKPEIVLGVTEAENTAKAQFGDERLLATSTKGSNGSDIVENVKQAVKEFRGTADQNDDITLMAIRYHC